MTIWMKTAHLAYLLLLLVASLLVVRDFRQYLLPLKMIALLIVTAFVVESIALYCNLQLVATGRVYYVFALLEVIWLCMYFTYSIPLLRRYYIGHCLCLATLVYGALLWPPSGAAGQSPLALTFVKCLLLMGLSFYASYRLALSKVLVRNWARHYQFWLPTLLIFYWASNFLIRGLYPHLSLDDAGGYALLHYTLLAANIITYAGYTLVLWKSDRSTKKPE